MSEVKVSMEGNEEYFGIFNQRNVLVDRFNKLDSSIHALDLPPKRMLTKRKEMDALARSIKQFENDVNDWRSTAWDYRKSPRFCVPKDDPNPGLTTMYYSNILGDLVDEMDANRFAVAWQFTILGNTLMYARSNRKWWWSFWIGIILGVVSCVLTITFSYLGKT